VNLTTAAALTAPPRTGHRRPDIQGLRAVAVLLVLVYHAGLPMLGGFIGVDVFFVVSGFVITALLVRELERTGRIDFTRFYTRRVRRLLPALALVTTVTVLASWALLPLQSQGFTGATGIAASVFLANFEIMRSTGGYFGPAADENALLHTWSLGVEEQFYLLFPALLFLGWSVWARCRRARTSASLTVLAVLVVSFALSLVLSRGAALPGISDPRDFAFYSSPTRAWQFAAGSMLALHWQTVEAARDRLPSWTVTATAWAGGTALAFATFELRGTGYPGTAALIPTLGTVVLLASTDADRSPVGRVLASRPMTWIGDLSYSIYLWHWPLLVLGNQLIEDPRVRTSLLLVLASFIPAWLSYRYVEDPIRTASGIRGRRVLALGAVCVILPATLSLALLAGSAKSWGNPELARWEELRTEQPTSRSAGCHSSTTDDLGAPMESCIFGEGDQGFVMVVGDSLAAALGDSVIAALDGTGYRAAIRTANGCPFVDDPGAWTMWTQPELLEGCVLGVQREWEEIASLNPAVVVIANRGTQYVPHARFLATGEDAALKWGESTEITLRTLQELGIPTLLVHQVPEHPTDLARCTKSWGVDMGCTSSARGYSDRRLQDIVAAERTAAEGVPGSTAWDPSEVMCDDTTCHREHAGAPTYRDDSHINPSAAALLGPALRDELLSLLGVS